MNSILISFFLIIIIGTVGRLLGTFFDISPYIYMPYIIWGFGLCIFNIILEKVHVNKFMINT